MSAPKLSVPMPMMAPSGRVRLSGILSSWMARSTVPTDRPVLPKLTPPRPPLSPRASTAHCTPRASLISPEISTMAASTITWARGTSRLRTISSRVATVSGSASRTRALRLSSARIRMFCGLLLAASPPSGVFSPSATSPRVSARLLASLWRRRITRALAERVLGMSSERARLARRWRAAGGPRMIRRLVRASAITRVPAPSLRSLRITALFRASAASSTQACCRLITL